MFLYISCISLNTGLFRSPTLGFMHACTILSSLRGGPFPTILAEPGPSQAHLGVQSNHAPLNRLHFPDPSPPAGASGSLISFQRIQLVSQPAQPQGVRDGTPLVLLSVLVLAC